MGSVPPRPGTELEALAKTINANDVLISARCYMVEQPKPHYEIVVHGQGESAIVDIPIRDEPSLMDIIEQILDNFLTALMIRNQS